MYIWGYYVRFAFGIMRICRRWNIRNLVMSVCIYYGRTYIWSYIYIYIYIFWECVFLFYCKNFVVYWSVNIKLGVAHTSFYPNEECTLQDMTAYWLRYPKNMCSIPAQNSTLTTLDTPMCHVTTSVDHVSRT